MDTLSKWLLAFWCILAIVCFVGAFFTPVWWVKVLGIVFGALNSLIILSLGISMIQVAIQRKVMKEMEKENKENAL